VDLLIELSSSRLDERRVHKGPPDYSENASEFLEKWRSNGLSEPYIEDGRWFVHVKREFTRADALLRDKIRDLKLGKDVKKLDDISVVSGKTLASKEYMSALTQHFDDRMPWERDE
ncbi:MAG: CCA-adding protein, partial [Thermoplasmata archaeon]|nr:CCA-adding protein [Thermoplasmata archaeon]